MRFNINDKVRVKLKPSGIEALEKNYHALGLDRYEPFEPPVEDEDGWSEWQLWRLVEEIGPHLCIGAECPIETEIDITVDGRE